MSELTDVAKKAFADKFDNKTNELLDKAYKYARHKTKGNSYSPNPKLRDEAVDEVHKHLDKLIPGIKDNLEFNFNGDTAGHIVKVSNAFHKIGEDLQHYTPEMKQDFINATIKNPEHDAFTNSTALRSPFLKHLIPDTLPYKKINSMLGTKMTVNGRDGYSSIDVNENHVKALASLPSYMHKTYVDMLPEWEQSPEDLANFVRMAHGE